MQHMLNIAQKIARKISEKFDDVLTHTIKAPNWDSAHPDYLVAITVEPHTDVSIVCTTDLTYSIHSSKDCFSLEELERFEDSMKSIKEICHFIDELRESLFTPPVPVCYNDFLRLTRNLLNRVQTQDWTKKIEVYSCYAVGILEQYSNWKELSSQYCKLVDLQGEWESYGIKGCLRSAVIWYAEKESISIDTDRLNKLTFGHNKL